MCGGSHYDPCSYTVEQAASWVPSVYIVGGAGVGKSTFTSQLLELAGANPLAPQEDLCQMPNARGTIITLRGHRTQGAGMYLGKMRDSFPGTDGLDRASSITGEKWLDGWGHLDWAYVLGEGATLATERFLNALHRRTRLLLVHLVCDPGVKAERLAGRGSDQAETFIQGTATRSANSAARMRAAGAEVLGIETSSEMDWEIGLDICQAHLTSR
jgi:hypothetical protein